MKRISISVFIIGIIITGCYRQDPSKAVWVLMDMSGPNMREWNEKHGIMKQLLSILDHNDRLVLARIDTETFGEKDIVGRIRFDRRPTISNSQKIIFYREMEYFFKNIQISNHRDLGGGLLYASEFFTETSFDEKYILIFSDFKEKTRLKSEKETGYQLKGVKVAAMNMNDPGKGSSKHQEYAKRGEKWRNKVKLGYGKWRFVDHLDTVFNQNFWEH